jgi:hypothetical protein
MRLILACCLMGVLAVPAAAKRGNLIGFGFRYKNQARVIGFGSRYPASRRATRVPVECGTTREWVPGYYKTVNMQVYVPATTERPGHFKTTPRRIWVRGRYR